MFALWPCGLTLEACIFMPDFTGINLERGFLSQSSLTNRMPSSRIDMNHRIRRHSICERKKFPLLVLSGFIRDN